MCFDCHMCGIEGMVVYNLTEEFNTQHSLAHSDVILEMSHSFDEGRDKPVEISGQPNMRACFPFKFSGYSFFIILTSYLLFHIIYLAYSTCIYTV